MNLQLTKEAGVLHRAYTLIDRNRGLDTRHMLGRCVAEYQVHNGDGRMASCNDAVFAGEGYADLDGEPFKAYYCAKCATKLLAFPDAAVKS